MKTIDYSDSSLEPAVNKPSRISHCHIYFKTKTERLHRNMEWKSQTTGILSTRLTVGRRERVHLPRQVQQVTCCPHPGDNLVMEIKPKYKADVGSPAAGSDGEVSTPAPWTSVWLGQGPRWVGRVRQPGKPVRYHYKYIWNNALFDLECKLTCIVNCIDTTCGTTRNYFLGLKHSIPGDSWSSRGL